MSKCPKCWSTTEERGLCPPCMEERSRDQTPRFKCGHDAVPNNIYTFPNSLCFTCLTCHTLHTDYYGVKDAAHDR